MTQEKLNVILENHKKWLEGTGGANLYGADLCGVRYNEQTVHFAMQCPEEGSYIGYKKA